MITTVKCDGCGIALSQPSLEKTDLCTTCKETRKQLEERMIYFLDGFIVRFKMLKTVNAMNKLFSVMEKRLAMPPPIPKEE